MTTDPGLRPLSDFEGCEGPAMQTPAPVYNRPGLTALAYRVGAYGQFKQALLARLRDAGQPALRGLTTRDTADFSIALLDAWAMVADVLTFYQERIANEAYLRTAGERLSLQELAQLIGYEPGPGVAAGTWLAFTLDDTPGAFGLALNLSAMARQAPEIPPPITIEAGAKVQSIPGPGEQPQTFETMATITARVEWNAMKPRLTQPQRLAENMKSVMLQGAAFHLQPGDAVLIVYGSGEQQLRTLLNISIAEETKTTRLDFGANPSLSPRCYERPAGLPSGYISDFPERVTLDDGVVGKIIGKTWREQDLAALVTLQDWRVEELMAAIARQTSQAPSAATAGVFVFRKRAAIFGHNALKQVTYGANNQADPPDKWSEWKLADDEADKRLFLDNVYEGLVPGGTIAIQQVDSQNPRIFSIVSVASQPRTAYGLSANTTMLTLSGDWRKPDFETIRTASIAIHSEPLPLAEAPVEDEVQGDSITLDRIYLGLQRGQKVILSGERSDLQGAMASELLTLQDVLIEAGFTVLSFSPPLVYRYVRKTVLLNANIAPATHGETAQDILGSGDAAQPWQRFTLRQPPLTYVAAATPSGAQTTLEVYVNELRWQEVPDFYGYHPDERIYVTRTDDEGKTTILFGDGKTGARLPTGQNNVRAKYRKGIGLAGLLKANQLSQLMTRPLGVRAVTNPLAPAGAAARESAAEIRHNAPLRTLTLSRIVSLQDYEDFTCAFSGIDKALASWTWIGERRGVIITVAGVNGAVVNSESMLYQNLREAIARSGDPQVPFVILSYQPRLFRVAAAIKVQPDWRPDSVLAAVEQTLREHFSFAARAFGQAVILSEVIAVMQHVPGVQAVAIKAFHWADAVADVQQVLQAALPRPGDADIRPAELLLLNSRALGLEVMP